MHPAIDLVLGRPRVALSPSRLLVGEVVTPYGALPTEEVVEAAWQSLAGKPRQPAWLFLGRRDTPAGTLWSVAWCLPTGPLPDRAEIVLPQAAWACECMNGAQAPDGWHTRRLESPQGVWTGLWEGPRCEHLQPPAREPTQAIELERMVARQRGATEVPGIDTVWREPTTRDLREMSENLPEADLLGLTESVQRDEARADRTAIARIAAILLVFAAVTGAFGIHQAWHAHQRRIQETRLESVRDLVDRAADLESSRLHQIDTLRRLRDALSRSHAPDLVLRAIAAKVPSNIRLQVLAMEGAPGGWRIRTEARLPDWNAVQPFAQGLRSIAKVSKVSVANQSRQSDAVAAILEIEGTWP
jgi:hypothetical protein